MSGLPTWAIWSIIAVPALLSPVLAFLLAIAVAILIWRFEGRRCARTPRDLRRAAYRLVARSQAAGRVAEWRPLGRE